MIQRQRLLQNILIFMLLIIVATNTYSQDAKGKSDKYLVGPVAFKSDIEGKKNIVVLDVRTPEEYKDSHIRGAINIDFKNQNFLEEIEKLDKGKKYYIYCRSGKRSANSRKLMNESDIKKVYDLDGGILAWKKQEYPVD